MGVAPNFPSERYHVTSLELNYVLNSNDLFIDFGGNVNMCGDKKIFSLYQEISTRTEYEKCDHVLEEGQVKLKLSFRNYLILNGVFHVSEIREKLIKYFFVSTTRLQSFF